MKKILLITENYPPVMGGSEIEAQRVAASLIERGHKVHILCAGGAPMPEVRDWTDRMGVPVRILTRRSRGVWRDRVFAGMVALYLWRLRSQYDTVYFLMQGLHLVTGLPVARLLGKPIFMKVSGSSLISLMQSTALGRLELKWLQRWARVLMVLNQGMVDEALSAGFRRDQIIWVPNPVDIEEFRPRSSEEEADELRNRFEIPLRARVVIYVGRLSHEKGLIELLRGFAQAAKEVPDSLLLLVGDGPQRAELESIAAGLELGADKVRFVGYIDIKQVPLWLRCSDVFALVSPAEGLSCALLEAMAAGLASVVSAIPANSQLIDDGVHGLTVPFGADDALGEAISRLLTNGDMRSRMAEETRKRAVEHYSTPKVVDRYEAIFGADRNARPTPC